MSEDTKLDRRNPPPALPEPPPEEFPRPFGNYLLLAPLARGGMGEVFLAKHGSVAGLEKHCVVKTLRPHLTDDREYTSRFIDEARIVVQLGHRNICHVFDVGTVGERYYLAMEYIAGKDLRSVSNDVAEKGGVVSPGLAIHVVSETLEALDYAHRHVDAATGTPLLLVHRDVSPQNVMLSFEGEVKLIDFGLAASTLKVEQTSPNVVMGKLAYMAPEQVRGEKVDGRADLFAVAVMLYEMLAGERFYEGRSPYEIWGIAAQGGYRPRGWNTIDPEMKAILDRGLAAQASARYATCLEMREALQGYMQAHGLRGDGPMLRALMHSVFEQQIEDNRKTLAALSKARVRITSSVSAPQHGHGEPTMSLARSPSQSLETKRALARAAGEGTEPTEHNLKPPTDGATKRSPLMAALGFAVIVGAIVVGARIFGAGSTTDADGHAAVVDAGATGALAATPGATATAVTAVAVDAGAVAAAPLVDAGAQAAALLDAGPALEDDVEPSDTSAKAKARALAKKRAKDAKAKLAKDAKDATKDDTKDDAKAAGTDATEPSDAAPETPPRFGDLRDKQRVEELAKRCHDPCTADVLAHRTDFGALGPDELKAWKAQLSKCWSTCGLPK